MSLLPKKETPQEWTDVVLPLFDQPAPEAPRVQSKKQVSDEAKVAYHRYKSGARVPCQDCSEGTQAGSGRGIVNSTYVRKEGPVHRYLCFYHKAEWQNRELLRHGSD